MRRAILTLYIYLTLYTISYAQANPPVSGCQNIIGTLRNLDTDEVIPNAKIALEHHGKIVAEIVSDNKGNYAFQNLEHGLYFIKATLYNYDYTYIDQVEITTCETQYLDLDFDLATIATLDPVSVVASKVTTTVHVIVCGSRISAQEVTPAISNEEYDIESDRESTAEISLRHLPGPAERAPDKPIKDLSIYPNPSFGLLNIELTFETLQLTLFDMLGHNLGTVPFLQLEDELVNIDLSQLPPGTYALQLQHEEGTDIQKVIILND